MIRSRRNPYFFPILLSSLLSAAAIFTVSFVLPSRPDRLSPAGFESSVRMEKALAVIKTHCEANAVPIDIREDPNRTGLIGPERSGLVTTPGNPAAKRTTTNPQVAGLIAHLLEKAGVGEGDAVAISASASFPALMIASVCAVQALNAHPVAILSLGASSYGASLEQFTLLDIYRLLFEKGLFDEMPAGVSLGGDLDNGREFSEEIREKLKKEVREVGIPLIEADGLRDNVEKRLALFVSAAAPETVSAFINCGGSYTSLGTNSLVLTVDPGLHFTLRLPPERERGMLYEMASKGVPVIHLLNMRGLARRTHLPWDPIPLPQAGEYGDFHPEPASLGAAAAVYFSLLAVIFLTGLRKKRRPS